MIAPPLRGPLAACVLMGLGWLTLVLIDPRGKSASGEYVNIGYLLGTLLGQTTLAAAWTAFGPLRWQWRLLLSFGWLAMLWIGLVINIAVHVGPGEVHDMLLFSLLGQWLVVQIPLRGLAWSYGLSLTHRSARPALGDLRPLQFGIRQLMILTAIVAVVLGVLRAIILVAAAKPGSSGSPDAVIFTFLAVVAVVMTLPLVMAALLPRLAAVASLVVLALIGLATIWEQSLLNLLTSTVRPDQWLFAFINAFTAAWVLAVIAAMRLGGYGLTTQAEPGSHRVALAS